MLRFFVVAAFGFLFSKNIFALPNLEGPIDSARGLFERYYRSPLSRKPDASVVADAGVFMTGTVRTYSLPNESQPLRMASVTLFNKLGEISERYFLEASFHHHYDTSAADFYSWSASIFRSGFAKLDETTFPNGLPFR